MSIVEFCSVVLSISKCNLKKMSIYHKDFSICQIVYNSSTSVSGDALACLNFQKKIVIVPDLHATKAYLT